MNINETNALKAYSKKLQSLNLNSVYGCGKIEKEVLSKRVPLSEQKERNFCKLFMNVTD